MYKDVYRIIIHNSLKLETTEACISRRMDQLVICLRDRIPPQELKKKKKKKTLLQQATEIEYVERKKPNTGVT